MDSACWGRVMKFLKKKGTASYSGGMVMVAGTSFRFQTNDSKSKIWSSGSGVCMPWINGMSCPWLLESDVVRDLLLMAICDELGSEMSKLAEGELL